VAVDKQIKARPNPEKPKNQWATQYDRELIVAARDSKMVDLYFNERNLLGWTPDLKGVPIVVDRYMLKLRVDAGRDVWVQKHVIVGVEIS
jgi:hypothetical protein